MARSLKKGPFVDEKLFRKVQHAKETRRSALRSGPGPGGARSCRSSSA